jgi:hypothetical protein
MIHFVSYIVIFCNPHVRCPPRKTQAAPRAEARRAKGIRAARNKPWAPLPCRGRSGDLVVAMTLLGLRSRLTHLELALLTAESATRFLVRICQAEGLAYDAPGLALLQAAVGGQPREIFRAIEKVTEFGISTSSSG